MRGHCSLINLNSRRLIFIFDNKYNNNKQTRFSRYSNGQNISLNFVYLCTTFDASAKYKEQVTEGENNRKLKTERKIESFQ